MEIYSCTGVGLSACVLARTGRRSSNDDGWGNKDLSLSNVYLILQNPFYYGVFEYPEKSGRWYQGKHEPLITKALFDKAMEQLKRDQIVRHELKEFAFTKLISCALCGSGVTATEKFKNQKNGNTHRYVYNMAAQKTRMRSLYLKAEGFQTFLQGSP